MVKIYPTLPCMAPLTIQEPSNLDSEPSDQLISQPRESPFQSSSSEQAAEQLIEQEKDKSGRILKSLWYVPGLFNKFKFSN